MARRPKRPARVRPYFVKVLFKGFSKKLMIPRKYVSLHGETLGKQCVLCPSHSRDSWLVMTKEIDNELYFKKGWKVFAQDHFLKYGDLLIFRHAQNSEFDVDVLDMTGTPREPVVSQNDQSLRDAARVPPSNIGQQRKSIIKTSALAEAEALISSSEFPSFKKMMKIADLIPGGYMYVPAGYAKKYIKDRTKDVQIEFSNEVWIVKILKRRPCESRTFLGTGWSDLARESNLQVDDVCVFQLISTKYNRLKLTIFRHTNAGRPKKTILEKAALSAAEALVASSKFPSFKKIMKPAYVKSGGCLHVPQHYAKEHLQDRTRDVNIVFSDKSSTVMVLRRQRCEKRTFLGGWSDLARENSLQANDVCVFELINSKDYTLKLTIFRHTSSENQRHKQCQVNLKSSCSELNLKPKQLSNKAFEEAEKSKELSDKEFKCGKNQKDKQVEVLLDSSDSEVIIVESDEEASPSDKALEEAKKFQSNSKHPSFVTVMHTAYVNHFYLHVPKTFVNEMCEMEKGKKVKLESSNNELSVNMRTVGGQWRMDAGWKAFVRMESIEIGDVCVFELINKHDHVIKISIFRCSNC